VQGVKRAGGGVAAVVSDNRLQVPTLCEEQLPVDVAESPFEPCDLGQTLRDEQLSVGGQTDEFLPLDVEPVDPV
jgi:hypothetical protein